MIEALERQETSALAEPRRDFWEWLLVAAIVATCLGMIALAFRGHAFVSLIYAARKHHWFTLLEKPSMLWVVMGTCMFFVRTLLWFSYRPFAPRTTEDAPKLTVIIPAYNEGPMVARSIDSVAAAHYPQDRLEIFVVDDGSKDDTWEHIQAAAARHPELVRPIRFAKNQGKRAALEEGFRRCSGEVVVTIDSDSVIDPGTLLAIAGPFRDPKVGAVAGKVIVYNRDKGLIPKMLHVRFILSFDFLRAAQSTYGIVYCCPGALAGYRISVVRDVIDEWTKQKFLGVPCTYGEDRAMTNFILGRGLKTVYQRSAVVRTIVPATYSKLCKMYLRWDRSYIREEFHFLKVFGSQPLGPRLMALLEATLTNLRYPVTWLTLVLLAAMTFEEPVTLLRVMIAIAVMSLLNMLYYLRSERSWDFMYGILYSYLAFFGLFWVFPYALFTVRARSWMTR